MILGLDGIHYLRLQLMPSVAFVLYKEHQQTNGKGAA
jgi:hypothetical protein